MEWSPSPYFTRVSHLHRASRAASGVLLKRAAPAELSRARLPACHSGRCPKPAEPPHACGLWLVGCPAGMASCHDRAYQRELPRQKFTRLVIIPGTVLL